VIVETGATTKRVVITFAEDSITGIDALHRLLTAERIGRSVALRLLRGREVMTLPVVPSARG
jgi:hypothetical protein